MSLGRRDAVTNAGRHRMLIDAHAHLDRYDDEALDAALAEIAERRILTISTAMDLPSYRRTLEIGERCEFVLPTFGVHPWNAPAYVNRLAELRGAIEQTPMLGEIGLDHRFIEDASRYPAQRLVFEFFLAAAKAQDKIVNLHTSGAEEEILSLLVRYSIHRAIVHWYSGPLDILREMIGQGFYFTIGVEVLHTGHIRAIAREVPSAQLLTETDNPVGERWLTGTAGMPCLIEDVVQALAELRGTTSGDIAETVCTNFARLLENDSRLAEIRRRIIGAVRPLARA